MEGDISIKNMTANYPYFNPLPPYGGRHDIFQWVLTDFTFQSTPSTRRETYDIDENGDWITFQSTPSTRRETALYFLSPSTLLFQSTPSTRRETQVLACNWEIQFISIHSLHTEGDGAVPNYRGRSQDFNPLPPHGGRRAGNDDSVKFLNISIHSLHTEGDTIDSNVSIGHRNFNPLPPHGGRLMP